MDIFFIGFDVDRVLCVGLYVSLDPVSLTGTAGFDLESSLNQKNNYKLIEFCPFLDPTECHGAVSSQHHSWSVFGETSNTV